VVLVIAQRQPVASDLREVVSTIRIASDLERVGDLGERTSPSGLSPYSERGHSVNLVRGIDHLGDLALMQLKEVLDAYGSRSVTRINMIRDRDDEIDAMYTSLFRELPDIHDGRSAQHHHLYAFACSAPRTSSASAIMRPISRSRSTTS
jgi:phosphate transport system protein